MQFSTFTQNSTDLLHHFSTFFNTTKSITMAFPFQVRLRTWITFTTSYHEDGLKSWSAEKFLWWPNFGKKVWSSYIYIYIYIYIFATVVQKELEEKSFSLFFDTVSIDINALGLIIFKNCNAILEEVGFLFLYIYICTYIWWPDFFNQTNSSIPTPMKEVRGPPGEEEEFSGNRCNDSQRTLWVTEGQLRKKSLTFLKVQGWAEKFIWYCHICWL